MITWSTDVPLFLASNVRISFDFAAMASGAKLYSAAAPAGVTVDGAADALSPAPASPWFQLSTPTGTLIQVVDFSSFGANATLANYYDDSLAALANDTGDGVRYGEIGLTATYPSFGPLSITYKFNLYAFADSQANIGSTYHSYYNQPLTATATRVSVNTQSVGLYLPMLVTEPAN